MSENITSGQEKPQNSPSVQQTSSQEPMMQPAPTAYAAAASIPATRPKITALAMTAFIVSLACALLRLGVTHKPVGPGQPQENNQGNVSDKQYHVDHNERRKGRRKTGRER